ncbi:hypothetical protein LP417_34295 (plasmid) [Polaromonas sp. P1-6]|nr:hypothetical protein LP417_34295 [Polaromonas sp. P1-6]
MPTALRRRAFAALALLGLTPFTQAQTERYPSRPIKIVVPYPPGGNGDNIARVFSKKLSDALGTPVVVDNRPRRIGHHRCRRGGQGAGRWLHPADHSHVAVDQRWLQHQAQLQRD